MSKQYEIRYHGSTHCYDWYCNDKKIKDPHIIENALIEQNKEIQYWKHKVATALHILGRYKGRDFVDELINEIENEGYNLDKELWKEVVTDD